MTEASLFASPAFDEQAPVRLFEEDPELFAALSPEGQLEARARAIAPMSMLACGPWDATTGDHCPTSGCLGLLVLEGLLVHSVVVASAPRSEVVGPGDLLRPWEDESDVASVPFRSEWDVIHPARLAVLDERFIAFASRWPELMLAIVARAVRRSHRLAVQLAITDIRRVDDRLLLFFWHLADRWGRVGPEGVTVPLPVTHDVLAQLVCAQRPTVTSSLKRLSDAGRIHRRPDRTWLLASEPPPAPAGPRLA